MRPRRRRRPGRIVLEQLVDVEDLAQLEHAKLGFRLIWLERVT